MSRATFDPPPADYAGPPRCLWCGRRVYLTHYGRGTEQHRSFYRVSEYFDTGACAAAFGKRLAELGRRLVKKEA